MAVAKVVTPEPVPTYVQLTLTKEEAEALFFVTGHIAGDPKTTIRKEMDDIRRVLRELDIEKKTFALHKDGCNLYFI